MTKSVRLIDRIDELVGIPHIFIPILSKASGRLCRLSINFKSTFE